MKTALFQEEKLLESNSGPLEEMEIYLEEMLPLQKPEAAILSDVSGKASHWQSLFGQAMKFHVLSSESAMPFAIHYRNPGSLGSDRLAAVAGARALFPNEKILVLCFGSCITSNLYLPEKGFMGGTISPGIHMRFRALHTMTGKLPLVSASEEAAVFPGNDSRSSIWQGVMRGARAEVKQMIEEYRRVQGELKVVVTGGEWPLFEGQLNYQIFADPLLILKGLNQILALNV